MAPSESSSWPRRVARSALGRAGIRLDRLGDGAFVVQRHHDRRVLPVGPPQQGSHVVLDEKAYRRNVNSYLNTMGAHLGERHVAWALRRLQITCVLDVGANNGQFGRRLRRSGYRGRIVSFEPVAAYAAQLRAAAADDPHWHVHELALGEEDTSAPIHVRPGTMSSLLPSSDFGKAWSDRLTEDTVETIQVRRLDGLLDEVLSGLEDPRIFLKLDTQGFDLPALRGAGDRIHEVLGLQSEVACVPIYDGMARLPEQITAYEEAGFEISGFYPVTRHRASMRAIEFDVIMVRSEAVDAGASV